MGTRLAFWVSAAILLISRCDGCSKPSARSGGSFDIYYVETADPVADVEQAIKRRDFRFVAMMGFTITVPDLPTGLEKFKNEVGVKEIEGTSDFIADYAHERLFAIARVYASAYNRRLIAELQRNGTIEYVIVEPSTKATTLPVKLQ